MIATEQIIINGSEVVNSAVLEDDRSPFGFLVTLIKYETRERKAFYFGYETDRFIDVMEEACFQREALGFHSWAIEEICPITPELYI